MLNYVEGNLDLAMAKMTPQDSFRPSMLPLAIAISKCSKSLLTRGGCSPDVKSHMCACVRMRAYLFMYVQHAEDTS